MLLLGHLDTVPPATTIPPRIDGDRIYGLGASDMKCADALILHLVEQRSRTSSRASTSSPVLYAREEGPFDESGMPEIVEAAPDPCSDDVDLAIAHGADRQPPRARLPRHAARTVRFQGQRAHSARPWEGRNAIHMAAPFLTALAPRSSRATVAYDGLLFREVCSATMVAYEGARNVIPVRFELNVNFRFAPDRTRSEALAWVAELVREAVGAATPSTRGEVTIEITDICPSGRVCDGQRVFRVAAGSGRPRRGDACEAGVDGRRAPLRDGHRRDQLRTGLGLRRRTRPASGACARTSRRRAT